MSETSSCCSLGMFRMRTGTLLQAGLLGGPPAPLPDEDLVAAVLRNDDDRLEDPGFLDGLGQLVDGLVVELRPRLERDSGLI